VIRKGNGIPTIGQFHEQSQADGRTCEFEGGAIYRPDRGGPFCSAKRLAVVAGADVSPIWVSDLLDSAALPTYYSVSLICGCGGTGRRAGLRSL